MLRRSGRDEYHEGYWCSLVSRGFDRGGNPGVVVETPVPILRYRDLVTAVNGPSLLLSSHGGAELLRTPVCLESVDRVYYFFPVKCASGYW